MNPISSVISTILRTPFFLCSKEELSGLNRHHLLYGLVITWIVGMGRYWDDPRAEILQKLGVGSVVYVFVLSFILWATLKPLKPERANYWHLLTFITLTALPGILYATPIEKFLSLETSSTINVIFLIIVALWRVSLYVFYLKRHIQLSWFYSFICMLVPIGIIFMVLTILNLQHVIINIMAGLREEDKSPHDDAYGFMIVFTVVFIPISVICFLIWLGMVHRARNLLARTRIWQ